MSNAAARTSLPRYIQISEMLIREIVAGALVDGARLPPERDMANSLDTSVGTLRKALADLVAKGLLERVQGSGNYVRHKQDVAGIYAFFRLEKIAGGGLPTAHVLAIDRLAKPASAPDFGPDTEGNRIRRQRYLDGEQIAVEEIWLDGAWADVLDPVGLSESLYHYYRRQLGLIVGRIEDRIGVAPVPEWADGLFRHAVGAPVGYIERISWDQHGVRAEYSRTWYDFERARYISRLGKG